MKELAELNTNPAGAEIMDVAMLRLLIVLHGDMHQQRGKGGAGSLTGAHARPKEAPLLTPDPFFICNSTKLATLPLIPTYGASHEREKIR